MLATLWAVRVPKLMTLREDGWTLATSQGQGVEVIYRRVRS